MDQYSVAKVIHLSALLGTKDDPPPHTHKNRNLQWLST